MPRNRNAAHLRVFRFLQLVWTEILTGELEIDSTDKTIKVRISKQQIVYTSTTNDHLIPDCTPLPDHPGEKRVEIALSRLSKIEQDEGDRKIIYLWIDANPFSLSFLSQDRATEACQVLQLIEENMEIEQNEEQQELTSIEYIKSLFESNPGMLSTLFINNNIEVVDVLFKLLALAPQAEMSSQDKQSYFHIFKTAIRVGDKKIVEALISDEHYQLLLTALSCNRAVTQGTLSTNTHSITSPNIRGLPISTTSWGLPTTPSLPYIRKMQGQSSCGTWLLVCLSRLRTKGLSQMQLQPDLDAEYQQSSYPDEHSQIK